MFDQQEFKNSCIKYFNKYKLECGGQIIKKFYHLANHLVCENQKYNLTAISDQNGIIIKHFVDSAIVLNHINFPGNAGIIDIGAGAGFPSLPIALLRGDLKISCLDSSAKKINFIKTAADMLELKNLDFFCGRAEESNRRGFYDYAVSRAAARLNILCELSAHSLKPGGVLCAYKSKGAAGELEACGNAFEILGLELVKTVKFELEGEERAFVIIKKTGATPKEYPRHFSRILKNPL
ncbi:MAG: 16S rRNA (guanine(527)-N(7))-methyltransferase RsmG [Oscillospiraceae bacterium]|nr:16S rRNA (guanine(527)-N(7))-methyltransferase RsmG [Oscillospiraceae bacterium]